MYAGYMNGQGQCKVSFQVVDPTTGQSSATGLALIDTGDGPPMVSTALVDSTGAQPISTSAIPVIGVGGSPTYAYPYLLDWYTAGGTVVRVQTLASDVITKLGVDALLGVPLLDSGVYVRDGLSGEFALSIGVATSQPVSAVPWRGIGLLVGIIGGGLVAGQLLSLRRP